MNCSWKCVTPSQAKHVVQPDHVMGICMCTPCLPTNERPGVVIGYSADDRLMNCSVIDLSTDTTDIGMIVSMEDKDNPDITALCMHILALVSRQVNWRQVEAVYLRNIGSFSRQGWATGSALSETGLSFRDLFCVIRTGEENRQILAKCLLGGLLLYVYIC